MTNVFDALFSSTWFWIVLVLVILILAFRPQLARLIDRIQKATIEASRMGTKVEVKAGPVGAAEKPFVTPPPPPTPAGQSVEVGHGAVISGSTFGDIGNVIVKDDAPAHAKTPGLAQAGGSNLGWNTASIREIVTAAWGDEELTRLCFDYFRPVYDEFSAQMSAKQKVQRLLDYCERHGQFNKLLELVRERNPVQYKRFEGRLRG